MQRTMEYSPQQSQDPSCQNGVSLNPGKEMQSEQSHIFSGKWLLRTLHLPQSTSTQFFSIKGQYAFLDSDTCTSGMSWCSTLSSKKDSKSPRDWENLSSFRAKFFFPVLKNILAALKERFQRKQNSEEPRAYHFTLDPIAPKIPLLFLGVSPTFGALASDSQLSKADKLLWIFSDRLDRSELLLSADFSTEPFFCEEEEDFCFLLDMAPP